MASMYFLALRAGGKLLMEGESLTEGYKNEIEVRHWEWGLTNNAPFALKESDATKAAHAKPLKIHKRVDKASTVLAKYCALGKHIPEGTITCLKHDGDFLREYLRFELRDIKIDAIDWVGTGEDTFYATTETIDLSFLKFSVLHAMQENSGQLLGTSTFDFDLGKHQEG